MMNGSPSWRARNASAFSRCVMRRSQPEIAPGGRVPRAAVVVAVALDHRQAGRLEQQLELVREVDVPVEVGDPVIDAAVLVEDLVAVGRAQRLRRRVVPVGVAAQEARDAVGRRPRGRRRPAAASRRRSPRRGSRSAARRGRRRSARRERAASARRAGRRRGSRREVRYASELNGTTIRSNGPSTSGARMSLSTTVIGSPSSRERSRSRKGALLSRATSSSATPSRASGSVRRPVPQASSSIRRGGAARTTDSQNARSNAGSSAFSRS